jgi:hypothetical protein
MKGGDIMQEVLGFATVIAPIIMAVVQIFKNSVSFPKSYIPLVAIVVGILIGWAAIPFTDLNLVMRLWAGGLAGLSGTGLYELVTPSKGLTK